VALNQYYGFAISGGANALTNSAYAALSTLRANGFVPGVASSEQANTVWRQATVAASGVAQFAANNQPTDVLDDGSPANFAARVQAAVDARIAALAVPTGMVAAWAWSTPPAGWLHLDGSSLLKSAYPALFGLIGTWWGGDTTHFNLPDLRGEFLRGWAASRVGHVDSGRAFGAGQLDSLVAHTHAIEMNATQTTGPRVAAGSGTNGAGTLLTNPTGGTETRPRNIALMYVIKT
jgi:microcystin-dependent protein